MENAVTLKTVFEAIPGNNVFVRVNPPLFTILAVTDSYLQATGRSKQDLVGKGIFEAFPANPNDPTDTGEKDLRASFSEVMQHKKAHSLPVQRYDIPGKDGGFIKRYWEASNKPVLADSGEVAYIIHTADDITDQVTMQKREKAMKGMEQAYNLFMQAPTAIHISKGPDLTIELANAPTLELWGREGDVIGKPFLEVLPELKGQGYDVLMQEVIETEKSKFFYEVPIELKRKGKPETGYFNFIYQPYYEGNETKAAGVLVFATEVTEQVLARKKVTESEQRLELAVEIGELGIFNIDLSATDLTGSRATYTQRLADWFEVTELSSAVGVFLSKVHPDDQSLVAETLARSIAGEWGGRHDFSYRVVHPQTGKLQYLRSIGKVKFEGDIPVSISGIIQDVTEQTLAIKKVEESEKRFRRLADQMPQFIWMTGPTGINVTYTNKPYLDFLGLNSYEAFLNAAWETLIHPDDLQLVHDVYGAAFKAREPYTLEARYKKAATGKYHWFLIQGVPRYEADGTFGGFIGTLTDITDRKEAETKHKESEAHLGLLSNTVPAMIFYLDAEQRYRSYNEAFMHWFGIDEKEALGKTVREFVGEEVYKNTLPHLAKAYAGEQEKYEMRASSRLNEGRWLSVVFTPHKTHEGAVMGVIVHATDITHSKQVEMALRESEKKFKSLIEEAPIATCLFVGRNLVIEVANQRMIELWGKDNSVLGKPLAKALPELEGQPFLQILDDVFTTGKIFEAKDTRAELEVNGRLNTYYFNFTYKPIRNGAGAVYAILEIAEDVTAQVLAKRSLEESEANLRNMILQSPIAMAILKGPSFIVEIANERMFELWGRGKEELLHKSIFEGLPEAKDQGYEQLLTGVFTTGKSFSALGIPVTLPRNGGVETVYINLLYEPFREGDGTISGIMAIATDVTEQVLARQKIEEVVAARTKELALANETLQQTNKELQRSNQNLEEFAHAASHDLKEPVRKIHFFTSQLKEQLSASLKESETRAFSRIENATERMGNLIDDLLLYSHVSQRPHEMGNVDLNLKLQRVLEDVELDIQEKRAEIHVGKLPVVKGYKRQLQQLFQNLITNALKYSKSDVAPQIYITAQVVDERGRRYHFVQVKDNGIGFDQEYADKIFQMFTRLHGRTEYSGTGVGLSIVKKVVENHNGFIRVESESGIGSAFNVYLPAD